MPGIGVVVNIIAVIVGAGAGVLAGGAIPERMHNGVVKAVGLAVFAIGLAGTFAGMAQVSAHGGLLGRYSALIFVGSLVLGSVIGEAIGIEKFLASLGHRLNELVARLQSPKAQAVVLGTIAVEETPEAEREKSLVEGFVSATLIFCVGSMTVLGSIQDGLGNPSTLYLKGMLDGIISIFLASTLGIGVAFSALPILVVQGSIAAVAFLFGDVIPATSIMELEVVGGVLIAAIGLELLDIKKLPIGNMLPAVFLAMLFGWIFG